MSNDTAVGLAATYKAEMCPHFTEGGEGACPNGLFCRHAHGAQDMRTPAQNEADGIVNEVGLYRYLNRLEQERTAKVVAPHSAPPTAHADPAAAEPRKVSDTPLGLRPTAADTRDASAMASGADEEEDVVFRLLSALDGVNEDEDHIIAAGKEALRKELMAQLMVCGVPIPPFLLGYVAPTY